MSDIVPRNLTDAAAGREGGRRGTDVAVGGARMRRLLTGGTVWAGAACTPRGTWVLVDGDRIAAIGDDDAPGTELPAADERVDVKGGHVLPGFVDVHLHLSQAAWFPQG